MSGSLYRFDLSSLVSYPIELIIHGWNSKEPFSWISESNGEQVAEGAFLASPGLPLFSPGHDNFAQLRDEVPGFVRATANCVPFMAYEVVQACATCPAAYELANSAPLLLILAVSHAVNKGMNKSDFGEMLTKRRRSVIAAMGLPDSQSLTRLISRVRLGDLRSWELQAMLVHLADTETLEMLRHHPDVHANHLRFLSHYRAPIWPGLLHLVNADSTTHDFIWINRMVNDSLALADGDAKRIRPVRSIQGLQDLHDRLVEQFNEVSLGAAKAKHERMAATYQRKYGDFPKPPAPGTDAILPLTSWLALLEEGTRMHHCVGSYGRPVGTGECFIYQMLSPERLTVSLDRRQGQWLLGEARGPYNKWARSDSLEVIQRWLREANADRG